jgi:hypothetical protein
MTTLVWVFMVAMSYVHLRVIALTIADVFESHKSPQSDSLSRIRPRLAIYLGAEHEE